MNELRGLAIASFACAALLAGAACQGTVAEPTAAPTLGPTAAPTATSAAPQTPTPAPTQSPAPTAAATTAPTADDLGPLTTTEISGLTLNSAVPVPDGAPEPAVGADEAEATVRGEFPGTRVTIGVQRVGLSLHGEVRVGWMVALTPAEEQECSFHAGLLPRALEGGIVDDQTGERFWIFGCPESLAF